MADKNKLISQKEIEDTKSVLEHKKSEFNPLEYVDSRIPPSLDYTLRGGIFLR